MRSSAWDWSPVGFEEDPTPGTVEEVETLAVELRTTAERLWHQSEAVGRVHGTIMAPQWSGVAAEVFAERLLTVTDGFRVAAARHRDGADAARSWAGALWETQEAADRALRAAEEAQADLALAEAAVGLSMADHTTLPTADIELIDARFRLNDAQLRLDDARAQARRAKDQYDAAEQVFVRQLDATLDGALPAATRPELEDFAEVTIMLTAVSHPAGAMDLFTSQGPDQVRKLLAASPGLAQSLWDSPPPPEKVAAWWKQLSPEEREQWCQAVPSIIGNLPGLDADTRIHANMIQFQRDLCDGTIAADSPQAIVMQDILKALRVNEFSGPLLDFEKLAKELTPPRGLLSYNIRHEPPLAAIAIGETSAEKSGPVHRRRRTLLRHHRGHQCGQRSGPQSAVSSFAGFRRCGGEYSQRRRSACRRRRQPRLRQRSVTRQRRRSGSDRFRAKRPQRQRLWRPGVLLRRRPSTRPPRHRRTRRPRIRNRQRPLVLPTRQQRTRLPQPRHRSTPQHCRIIPRPRE